MLLGDDEPDAVESWRPSAGVPDAVRGVPGLWFWGNTALELRWHRDQLRLHELGDPDDAYVFELRGDRIVGIEGYHRGEILHVVRRDDGSVQPPGVRDVRLHPRALRPRRRHPRRPPEPDSP